MIKANLSNSVIGLMLRYLLPGTILIPIIVAIIHILSMQSQIFTDEFGIIFFAFLTIILFLIVIVTTAIVISKSEAKFSSAREIQLHNLVKRLEDSNQELERFAYIASHDLQEPLRMVSSFTQLLAKKYKDKLDPEAQELIHFAVDGARRMQQLIVDLLAYSRVSTRGKHFVNINIEEVVEEVLKQLEAAIEETHAEIIVEDLPTIYADDAQLKQLFQNLISNAIKFKKENKHPVIHISAAELNGEWRFCVTDNGIGIPEEFHQQVFLIFQRLHTVKDYPGTGVGLAICKKIIDRHGGKIWVESEPGKGATFCFTIPN